MHKGVLSKNQIELLSLLETFSRDFGLIGGTAIALQMGHRSSIDFDLATANEFRAQDIRSEIGDKNHIESTIINEANEYTLVINGVKVTFLRYPFKIDFSVGFQNGINMPSLTTLAAMKAYALGRRAKWKDYVDLYFILGQYSFTEITARAKKIFGDEFNEKLFREELGYFDDIDYSEQVDFISGHEVSADRIKEKLSKLSLQRF